MVYLCCLFFFFKQKTAYEMRISDWSSDVCSSDLVDFMEREGLTAPGLVDQSLKFRHGKPRHDDKMELYGARLRDTHDLFHIRSGPGRDARGHQCWLTFSYSNTPRWGTLSIDIGRDTARERACRCV